MRTLIISDLHLGGRLQHDVLRRSEPLERLLAAVADVDRLVLLGDIVELMEGRAAQAMSVAQPVLRALGAGLGRNREVLLVPGNHDHPLVRRRVRALGRELRPQTPVPLDASPALGRLAEWLAPARVRVYYPGVWLTPRVWATHGHYLDRHLLPESAVGIARGMLGRPPTDGAVPIDYELARGPSFTRLESALATRLPRPLAVLVEDAIELMRAATMPSVHRLLHQRFAPLTARLAGIQMRRASIPALARVVHRLGIDAEFVVFGHVHRLGPLAGDDPRLWQGPGERPRVVNAGSWVYEPLLVHRAIPPHPYWPGGAVRLDDAGEPSAVSLLDDLSAEAMRAAPTLGGDSPLPLQPRLGPRMRCESPNSCHR